MSVSRTLFNEALATLNNVTTQDMRNRELNIRNVAKPVDFCIFLIYSFLKTPNNGLTDAEKSDVRTTIYEYAKNKCGCVIGDYHDYLSDNNLSKKQLNIDQFINTIFVNNDSFNFDEADIYTGNDGYNIPYGAAALIRELLADGF